MFESVFIVEGTSVAPPVPAFDEKGVYGSITPNNRTPPHQLLQWELGYERVKVGPTTNFVGNHMTQSAIDLVQAHLQKRDLDSRQGGQHLRLQSGGDAQGPQRVDDSGAVPEEQRKKLGAACSQAEATGQGQQVRTLVSPVDSAESLAQLRWVWDLEECVTCRYKCLCVALAFIKSLPQY